MVSNRKTWQLDPAGSGPLYKRLLTAIRHYCRTHKEGSPFPPERELAEELGVSRTALRHALELAEQEKLIVRCWAKGTYVASREPLRKLLLILPDSNDITRPWNYIIPGIHSRCEQLGVMTAQIPVRFMRSQPTDENLAFLRRENFTGIFHFDTWQGSPELDALEQSGIPVLFPHSWNRLDYGPFYYNRTDVKNAFDEALQELVSAGHHSIVSIGTQSRFDNWRGRDEAEYEALLQSRGADPSPDLRIKVPYDQNDLERELGKVLAKRPDASAVLCFSDFYAMMVLEFLRKIRIPVPERISVMGFCGYPGGAFLSPPLSTIDFGYREIGIRSVDRILAIAAGNDPQKEFFSPYRLVRRDSVRNIRSDSCNQDRKPFFSLNDVNFEFTKGGV